MFVGGFRLFEMILETHKLIYRNKSSRRKLGNLGKCSLRKAINSNIWWIKRFSSMREKVKWKFLIDFLGKPGQVKILP